jgi:hypothetical protein
VIAIAKLPPPVDPPETRFARPREIVSARRRVSWLRGELESARRQLVHAERRDRRLDWVAAATRAGRSPALLFELPVAEPNRRAIAERLGVVWQRLVPTSPEIAVGIVIVDYGWVTQTLPPATDGRSCLVELPLVREIRWLARTSDPMRNDQVDPWLASGLGPCGFYAAFGRPGPHVERWLVERSFDLAWETDWTSPTLPAWEQRPGLPPILRGTVFWERDDRYGASLDAVACNAGALDRCRAALFGPERSDFPYRQRRIGPGVVSRAWWTAARNSLYDGDRYFVDLIREMGRERFTAFWRSPQPVERAFHDAFGLPIERWTARWERTRMGHLRVGPRIRPLSIFIGLFAAALCVAGGAYFARRRQVV